MYLEDTIYPFGAGAAAFVIMFCILSVFLVVSRRRGHESLTVDFIAFLLRGKTPGETPERREPTFTRKDEDFKQ